MNFLEVLKLAEETGQTFRRRFWDRSAGDLEWTTAVSRSYLQCRWVRSSAAYICTREDMFADDWELVSLPPKPMSFMEAVKHMKQGCSVRRLAWPVPCSLKVDDGAIAHYTNRSYTGNWLAVGDVESSDWILIDESNDRCS